jgi:hypothetical protein
VATYNKFEDFVNQLCQGVFDLDATGDTLNIYLSNAVPSASLDTIKTDLAEISTGNGYTGPEDTQQTWAEASGTGTLTGTKVVITASGGSIATFQYIVLYDDTPTSPVDPLIAWWDYGSALTLNDGESLTIKFNNGDPTGTIFTIS